MEYKKGNKEIFDLILKKYNNLYLIVRKYNINNNTIYTKDDLYQITLISLLKALDNFNTDKGIQFSTYLYRIAINDMNTIFRPSQKRSGIIESLDAEIEGEKGNFKNNILTSNDNIEITIIEKCEKEFMNKCLIEYKEKFPKKYLAVELALQGYTYRDMEDKVPYKRETARKNFLNFCEYCRNKAIEEGIVNI